ncbi:kinetochore complex Sim4 subunit Fta1-domain-containing protein [Nemania serpens]|nr:kinetochore complex Sim4 subunit Fta1-domain-containing protein [Nemania serpens]
MLPSLDDDTAEERRKIKRKVKGKGKEKEASTGDRLLDPRNPPSWTQTGTNPRNNPDTNHGDEDDQDNEKDTTDAFAHYPLLLTRMPAALKTALLDFLSRTFDCRVGPLRLGTRTLVRSWERWIEESGVGRGRGMNRDVALTLGFHLEPPTVPPAASWIRPTSDVELTGGGRAEDRRGGAGEREKEKEISPHKEKQKQLGLKTIDVVVPADEVRRFLRVGKKNDNNTSDSGVDGGRGRGKGVKRPADATRREEEEEEERLRRRRRLGGGRDEEGWWWREIRGRGHTARDQDQDSDIAVDDRTGTETGTGTDTFPQPFTNALATYLSHHLALDIYHPGVRVLRVVCDAFALSEGRMKVFVPPSSSSSSRDRDREGDGDVAVETFMRDLVRGAQGPAWGSAALRLAGLEVVG